MVERLGEDEDDGRQGDGDVACCGDDELFLQAASVGHKTTKYFGCLRQEYIGRREIEDRSCTSLVEVQRRLVGGTIVCLQSMMIVPKIQPSVLITISMHQCYNNNATAYNLGFVALRKPRP